MSGLIQLVQQDRLRFQNGCHINVEYRTGEGEGTAMKTAAGIILGTIDIPSSTGTDTFSYWVQLLETGDDNRPKILHEVNPSQVSYRAAEVDDQVVIKV